MIKHLALAAVLAAALDLTGMAHPTPAYVIAFTATAAVGTLLCRSMVRQGHTSRDDTGVARRPTVTAPVVPATGNGCTLGCTYVRLPRATTTTQAGYGTSRSLLLGTLGVDHSVSLVGVRR